MHAPAFNRTLRLSFGFIFTGEETLAFSGTKLKPWKNTAAFNVLWFTDQLRRTCRFRYRCHLFTCETCLKQPACANDDLDQQAQPHHTICKECKPDKNNNSRWGSAKACSLRLYYSYLMVGVTKTTDELEWLDWMTKLLDEHLNLFPATRPKTEPITSDSMFFCFQEFNVKGQKFGGPPTAGDFFSCIFIFHHCSVLFSMHHV